MCLQQNFKNQLHYLDLTSRLQCTEILVGLEIFFLNFICSGELSVQVAVEMPFDIKTIESPTHKIKLKVCFVVLCEKYLVQSLKLFFLIFSSENKEHGHSGVVSSFHSGGGVHAACGAVRDPCSSHVGGGG